MQGCSIAMCPEDSGNQSKYARLHHFRGVRPRMDCPGTEGNGDRLEESFVGRGCEFVLPTIPAPTAISSSVLYRNCSAVGCSQDSRQRRCEKSGPAASRPPGLKQTEAAAE